MLQEFHQTTILTKYIKYLITRTPLPIYKYIYDNEEMQKGCVYTYKDKVLLCTESGRFVGITGSLGVTDYLTVKDPLRISDTTTMRIGDREIPLSITDDCVDVDMYYPASFVIVNDFLPGVHKIGVTQLLKVFSEGYDYSTHLALGEYLRYLSNMHDLHLMSMYNCFGGRVVDNFQFSTTSNNDIDASTSTRTKILLAPVKFGKTYTVALDSDVPVYYRAVFYNNELMMDKDNQEYLHTHIDSSLTKLNQSRFSSPIAITIPHKSISSKYSNQDLLGLERYLYLAVQVPVNSSSSFVVLEGDFTKQGGQVITDVSGVTTDDLKTLSDNLLGRVGLLSVNDNVSRPFSDKLAEFLLRNTIDTREFIDENVSKTEKALNYFPDIDGVWDEKIQYMLYTRYMKAAQNMTLPVEDITGYVDSDMEYALERGYLQNG